MKKRIFKVNFTLRVSAGGVYKMLPLQLTILAENEKEAKKKLMETIRCEVAFIKEANEITLT